MTWLWGKRDNQPTTEWMLRPGQQIGSSSWRCLQMVSMLSVLSTPFKLHTELSELTCTWRSWVSAKSPRAFSKSSVQEGPKRGVIIGCTLGYWNNKKIGFEFYIYISVTISKTSIYTAITFCLHCLSLTASLPTQIKLYSSFLAFLRHFIAETEN